MLNPAYIQHNIIGQDKSIWMDVKKYGKKLHTTICGTHNPYPIPGAFYRNRNRNKYALIIQTSHSQVLSGMRYI